MSPVFVRISEHAASRMKQRGITRRQVRRCLTRGKAVGVDITGRRIKRIRVNHDVLEVIYLEVAGGYLVVTAYVKGVWP